MENVRSMTTYLGSRHRQAVRVASILAASALALTACSGGDDEPTASADTESASPTPSSTVEVPKGLEITEPGTQLAFGDTATVAYEDPDQATALKLRVDSAEQGSLEDFEGFDLDDPYKKKGNYYYVRVMAKNAGKDTIGGVPVPLWGISGDNTLLQAVEFKSSFAKCPTEPLPDKFKPKDTFKTCLVFLSPDKGKLVGVSYRPTEQFVPIEWRGQVEMLPTPKQDKKGAGNKQ
jgi:hypothetical protein